MYLLRKKVSGTFYPPFPYVSLLQNTSIDSMEICLKSLRNGCFIINVRTKMVADPIYLSLFSHDSCWWLFSEYILRVDVKGTWTLFPWTFNSNVMV